eukprot:CAMPEP_0182561764 /NCGR_PEP_ID=MMETSP1324-20130603/4192_1 /TAXON_ID=236786 /ORGANISM="Florenciella sp., Strain RCC1587" /LENGTH=34 /DNA_ID= /DNA_START= /DNA_END= /DNA_ORIENTATION=
MFSFARSMFGAKLMFAAPQPAQVPTPCNIGVGEP